MLWIVIAAAVLYLGYRYVKSTNHKWVLMNNIILAKTTYEQLPPEQQKQADDEVRELLRLNPEWGKDISNLPGEAVKWRFYSLALGHLDIRPNLNPSLYWTSCRNIYEDVKRAISIYRFDERLQNGEYSESHLNLMR